jgi:hypothetical protein
MAAGKRPGIASAGEPQKVRACHTGLEKLIDGEAVNISFDDNAFSIHDKP